MRRPDPTARAGVASRVRENDLAARAGLASLNTSTGIASGFVVAERSAPSGTLIGAPEARGGAPCRSRDSRVLVGGPGYAGAGLRGDDSGEGGGAAEARRTP